VAENKSQKLKVSGPSQTFLAGRNGPSYRLCYWRLDMTKDFGLARFPAKRRMRSEIARQLLIVERLFS